MAHYEFHKDASGSKLVEAPEGVKVEKVEVAKPVDAASPKKKRYECMLCHKTYAGQGVFSIHMKRNHLDVVGDDKDGWRSYVKEV
jgi:hypothetical protein